MGWGENDRGVSFTFGPEIVSKFLTKHDLDLICRAHQVCCLYMPSPPCVATEWKLGMKCGTRVLYIVKLSVLRYTYRWWRMDTSSLLSGS